MTVGAGAVIGAGTTVYRDVPPGALALTRPEFVVVEGWAERKRQKMLGLAPPPRVKKVAKKKVAKTKPKRRRG